MSNSIKKISSIGLSITTAVWLSGAAMVVAPVVMAATVAELEAQVASLLASLQLLQQQLSAAKGTAAPTTYNFTKDLTLGSKGDDVKALQQFLNASGYPVAASGPGSAGNETTTFGSLTKAALTKYQAAKGISPAAGYFGSKTRAFVASLAVAPTAPGVTPTVPAGTGLALALASDNPASGTIPKSASGVPLLKFTVSGKGTLTGLTFKRKGIGATGDFASTGFYLYEGNTRLTTGRSVNSTTHEVTFVNLALAVDGVKTLSLVADVASGATSGNIHFFELVSATGDPTPSGSLVGNAMSIGSQQVGGVVAEKTGSLSSTTVGQVGAQLSEIKLTASSTEDILIKQIAITQGGSISNSNLSNFTLKDASGNVLAKTAAVGAKDLITFVFDTAFLLEKGQNRTFRIFGDIGGSAKSGDTIKLYFDSKGDIVATGKTYGYSVDPDITALDVSSEAHSVALKGGDVTITFNGPISGDVALRGQDIEVFNFTIAAKNNVEIRNLRTHATTTGLTSGEGFNDMKVWDVSANAVITSATDVTTSTDVTYTDIINLKAGQTRTFKITVDVDADNDTNDDIRVSLLAFTASDIKNLDNNQFVATSDIVPNSVVSGNTLTVKAPSIDIQLSATPSSQTYVQGATAKSLVAFSFRATADTIKVSSLKITGSATTGTLTSGEVTNLALYDGATKVSDTKSLDSSDLTATFDNMNVLIASGQTKTLTVKGGIATDATNNDVFVVKIASTTTDLTATDSNGNTATQTGFATNSASTVSITVASVGDVTVVKAADDVDTEEGVILADGERVLAKFRFTSTNEDMTVNKLHILLASSSVSVANSDSGTVVDDVPTVKLYEGTTLVGNAGGYTVQATGASSSIAVVEGLNWVIPKDSSKTLTVKGMVAAIGQSGSGADFGSSIWTSVMAAGFEAQGATAKDTAITAAKGNEKVVYKTSPRFTSAVKGADWKLTAGTIPVLKFKIKADGPDQIAWKQIQFKVTMTQASMSAVEANPGTTVGNVGLRDITGGASTQLNIASAFSSTSTTTGEQVALGSPGGQTGYVSLLLNAERTVPAGEEKEYELSLAFTGISGTVGLSTFVTQVHRTETSKFTGTVTGVRASISTTTDAAPSFVWSDYSVAGHTDTEGPTATSTADWANGYLLKGMPSNTATLSN